jgi:hypothetical protein
MSLSGLYAPDEMVYGLKHRKANPCKHHTFNPLTNAHYKVCMDKVPPEFPVVDGEPLCRHPSRKPQCEMHPKSLGYTDLDTLYRHLTDKHDYFYWSAGRTLADIKDQLAFDTPCDVHNDKIRTSYMQHQATKIHVKNMHQEAEVARRVQMLSSANRVNAVSLRESWADYEHEYSTVERTQMLNRETGEHINCKRRSYWCGVCGADGLYSFDDVVSHFTDCRFDKHHLRAQWTYKNEIKVPKQPGQSKLTKVKNDTKEWTQLMSRKFKMHSAV